MSYKGDSMMDSGYYYMNYESGEMTYVPPPILHTRELWLEDSCKKHLKQTKQFSVEIIDENESMI